jgi:hypothetical protein
MFCDYEKKNLLLNWPAIEFKCMTLNLLVNYPVTARPMASSTMEADQALTGAEFYNLYRS